MKIISITNLSEFFCSLGIDRDDSILIHSDLRYLGRVEKNCDGIYLALKNIIGESGNLIVPTFSFSFCNGEDFNVKETKSTAGVFSEYARNLPESFRTIQPNHSFAGIGSNLPDLLEMRDKTSFGKGSALGSMLKYKVKVLLLGSFAISYIHYVEKIFGVEYRYNKQFSGNIINGDNIYKDTFSLYVRDLKKKGIEEEDRHNARNQFFDSKACMSKKIGFGIHRLFYAQDFCDFMFNKLEKDPLFLVDKSKYRGVK